MKIKYVQKTDVLYIQLTDIPVKESDEERRGVILDYAEDGSVVGIEILNASKNLSQLSKVEYEVA